MTVSGALEGRVDVLKWKASKLRCNFNVMKELLKELNNTVKDERTKL